MADLTDFIRESVQFYRSILSKLLEAFKKFWYVSLFLGLICASLVYKNLQQKHYQGTLVFTYNYMDEPFYGKLLEELALGIGNPAFGEQLNLEESVAAKIQDLKVTDFRGNRLLDRKSEGKTPIYLNFQFSENTDASQIQSAFTAHLNENKFIQQKINKHKALLSNRITFLKKEMAILDSLKRNKYSFDGTVQTLSQDFAGLFAESEKKFQELQELKTTVIEDKAVEVFQPLTIAPVKSSFAKTLIKYAVVWVVASVFISLFFFVIRTSGKGQ